jgi:hypothetical protein
MLGDGFVPCISRHFSLSIFADQIIYNYFFEF